MTPSPEVSRESATRRRSSTIVVYEILGFVAIIALSWINELLGLPSLIFGTDHLGGWHESLLETSIILLGAIPVVILTRRLVARLRSSACARGVESCTSMVSGSRWRNSFSASSTRKRRTESAPPAGRSDGKSRQRGGRASPNDRSA